MVVESELIDIIFSFSRCLREKISTKSEIQNLTIVQLQTMVFLSKEKYSVMKNVAEYLHIQLPSATELIDHLTKLNLVKRQQDKKDKRFTKISLTLKGKRLIIKVKKERRKHIENILILLNPLERKQLLKILKKITKFLEVVHEK